MAPVRRGDMGTSAPHALGQETWTSPVEARLELWSFGGGVDTKPILRLKGLPLIGELPIGGRFEVRGFYSGQPNYGLPSSGSRQNTVSFTGGLLLRF